MPVEKVSYLFYSWKMRETDPLKDSIKLFLPPLVPAATLRPSAIYYVLTRKVHYTVRGHGLASAGLASHPTALAAPCTPLPWQPLCSHTSFPYRVLGNMMCLFLCQNVWGSLAQQVVPIYPVGSVYFFMDNM